jgi:tyrosinase
VCAHSDQQKLQSVAKGIADKFPSATKSKYQDAATKLRVPYWDSFKALATSTPIYPTAISNAQVQVTFANGTKASIDNPLYNYRFHPFDTKQINGTVRSPLPLFPMLIVVGMHRRR